MIFRLKINVRILLLLSAKIQMRYFVVIFKHCAMSFTLPSFADHLKATRNPH